MEKFEIKNNKLIKFIGEPETTKVIIPDGIEIIDKYAFSDCHNIVSIYIPKSVRLIDGRAFENCPDLMEFSVDENNMKFCTFKGNLYEKSNHGFWCLEKVPEGMEYVEILNTSWWLSAFSEYSKFSVIRIYNRSGNTINLKRSDLDKNGEYSKNFMCNINSLICNLDTSVKMSRTVKAPIIMQMYFSNWSGFHNIDNFSNVFKGLIDGNETEIIQKILVEGRLITKRNINSYIRYADEKECYEVFDMLEEYREENNF